ncbi:hypothetical protein DICPUDRAFT_53560 [Dictyostelium purpureum]|uniref:Phospholipid/glycerol acyltransferase domain-containing protein n=1 Tax=Dictyostelium purpureum TaxID=5786 RepID=F0ZDG5_DICPU|nr:uncharacterized protein DICPUDRAFT_53560 [Dictyostelium purpureum]EGC37975.1 hypothetical protein DICPUDRAFT_53560 [Dictyostelium purpureum]|eukprot:XP_003285459.1 hypothetical protein DICPUDRAFT_53560 [Dictyostelium purpureum]
MSGATKTTPSSPTTGTKKPIKRYLHNYGRYSSVYKNSFALWAEKWYRRSISISLISIVLVVLTILFPVLAIVALAFDMYHYKRRKGLNYVRILSFFESYLLIEAIALFSTFLIYALYMVSLVFASDPEQKRYFRWNYWYQSWWGGKMLFGWSTSLLGIQVELEIDGNVKEKFVAPYNGNIKQRIADSLGVGPKIVFSRHASFADTLVPQGIFSQFYHMRYIVKKELLWDPALDVSGSRTPNFFLFRDAGTDGMDVEMDAIRSMVSDFKPSEPDVTCIWPEGTRFSKSKREKVLESFKKKNDTKNYQLASNLKHTLLPRVGGVLALLESNPCGDILFCYHFGMEASSNFSQMMNGELCNRVVKIKFEQIKYKDIPKTKQERIDWLLNKWVDIDKWVAKQDELYHAEKGTLKPKKN